MTYFPPLPAASGNVSQSTVRPAVGTGVSSQPLVNILTAAFRPKFCGTKFDSSTDDTQPWLNLLADVSAHGFRAIWQSC